MLIFLNNFMGKEQLMYFCLPKYKRYTDALIIVTTFIKAVILFKNFFILFKFS